MSQTTRIQSNGLPLSPIDQRTTNANFLAKRGPRRPAPASKIGTLLGSKVHSGASR